MRLTGAFCHSFGRFAVSVALGCAFRRVVDRSVIVPLTTAAPTPAPRALGLLVVLITSSALCAGIGSLLLRVGCVVPLGLAVSAVAAIVAIVSAAAVTLSVAISFTAIVTLSIARSVAGPSAILFAFAATTALTLFGFVLAVIAKQKCPEARQKTGFLR